MEVEEDGIQFQLKKLYEEKEQREEERREQAKSCVTPSSHTFRTSEDSCSNEREKMINKEFAIDYLDD